MGFGFGWNKKEREFSVYEKYRTKWLLQLDERIIVPGVDILILMSASNWQ